MNDHDLYKLITENKALLEENYRFKAALEEIWSLNSNRWRAGMEEAHKICERELTR